MSNGKPFQGGPGCPSYTAPVFGSLYIKDPLAPPGPIDGPVPASPYIIPLPAPTPCTCLSFDVWPNTGTVLRLVPPSQQAKGLGLSFKPKTEDNCCDGRFDVTTDLELPCIPFTIKNGVARTTTVDGNGDAVIPRGKGLIIQVSAGQYNGKTVKMVDENGDEVEAGTGQAVKLVDSDGKPLKVTYTGSDGAEREYRTGRGYVVAAENGHYLIQLSDKESGPGVEKFGIRTDGCNLIPELSLNMPCIPDPEYKINLSTFSDGVMTTTEIEAENAGSDCHPEVSMDMSIPCPVKVDTEPVVIQAKIAEPEEVPDDQQIQIVLEPDAQGCGVKMTTRGENVLYLPSPDTAGPEEWVTDVKLVWVTSSTVSGLHDDGQELNIEYSVKSRNGKETKKRNSTGIRRTAVVRKSEFTENNGVGEFTNEKCKALVFSSATSEIVFTTVKHVGCMDN